MEGRSCGDSNVSDIKVTSLQGARLADLQGAAIDGGVAGVGVAAGQRQGAAVVFDQVASAADDAAELLVGGAVVVEGAAVGDRPIEGCAQAKGGRASEVQGASGVDCDSGSNDDNVIDSRCDSPCAVEGATTDGGVFGVGVVPGEGQRALNGACPLFCSNRNTHYNTFY